MISITVARQALEALEHCLDDSRELMAENAYKWGNYFKDRQAQALAFYQKNSQACEALRIAIAKVGWNASDAEVARYRYIRRQLEKAGFYCDVSGDAIGFIRACHAKDMRYSFYIYPHLKGRKIAVEMRYWPEADKTEVFYSVKAMMDWMNLFVHFLKDE